MSRSRKMLTVLKAVTHEGDTIHFWTRENLSNDHAIRVLRALAEKFGEKLVVLFDQTPYLYGKDLNPNHWVDWAFRGGLAENRNYG